LISRRAKEAVPATWKAKMFVFLHSMGRRSNLEQQNQLSLKEPETLQEKAINQQQWHRYSLRIFEDGYDFIRILL